MGAAWRHLILNDTISSKVFSKSLHIYISKGEKLLSFHSVTPPSLHPPPPRGDFYFYIKKGGKIFFFFKKKKKVCFPEFILEWVCRRVMSHQHIFPRAVCRNVLGKHLRHKLVPLTSVSAGSNTEILREAWCDILSRHRVSHCFTLPSSNLMRFIQRSQFCSKYSAAMSGLTNLKKRKRHILLNLRVTHLQCCVSSNTVNKVRGSSPRSIK